MSSRPATYGAALNFLRLYLMLERALRCVPEAYILKELDISTSTLKRYVRAINEYVGNEDGGKLIKQKVTHGERYLFLSKKNGV